MGSCICLACILLQTHIHKSIFKMDKLIIRILTVLALILASTKALEDAGSTTTAGVKKVQEDGEICSQNVLELIKAINSSLVSLDSRVMKLESQVAVLSENNAGTMLEATSKLLQMYKDRLRKLEDNASQMNMELKDLANEYKRALGRPGGISSPGDLHETLVVSNVSNGSDASLAPKSSIVYDVRIVPEICLKTPPVISNYTPLGTTWRLGDMDVYETPYKNNASQVLIFAYDIFGFHNNTKQIIDILAAGGDFRIVIPDYFRGQPFPTENFPPKDRVEIQKFLQQHGWNDHVRNDTVRVIDYFKEVTNQTSFGFFGICWGGKMSVGAATDLPEIKVAALIHPSSVKTEEANDVKASMYLLPSRNEPDMVPFYNILRTNLGDSNCGHKRFDNAPHGFIGARSNYSDPEQVQAVNETLTIINTFFHHKLAE